MVSNRADIHGFSIVMVSNRADIHDYLCSSAPNPMFDKNIKGLKKRPETCQALHPGLEPVLDIGLPAWGIDTRVLT